MLKVGDLNKLLTKGEKPKSKKKKLPSPSFFNQSSSNFHKKSIINKILNSKIFFINKKTINK